MRTDRKQKSKQTFDKDAAGYDQARVYEFVRSSYKSIVEEALKYPFSNYLDIGCGTGALMTLISQHRNGVKLSGLDLSENMLAVAKAKLPGAHLVNGDSEKLPFSNASFDLVTCTFSFHHYPHPHAVVREMKRILAPHGKLIIADPSVPFPLRQVLNLLLPFSRKGDVRVYSEKEMREIVASASLKVLKWHKINWHDYIMIAEKP